MDIYHTIIRPLVTEKSTHQTQQSGQERAGAYSFEVHPEATKSQVRDAVEKIYKVKVKDVRTMNRHAKARRFRFRVGHSPRTKKAIVTLEPNYAIDLF